MEKQPEPIFVVPAGRGPRSYIGSFDLLARHEHVHNDRGECLKNRYYTWCPDPLSPGTIVTSQPPEHTVAVYHDGRHNFTVSFKHKWQAYLFHVLLNRSTSHEGSRYY